MLNWTKEFFQTYNDVPKYSFNFYTEISHDDFNLVQIADEDIVDWFNSLDALNVFNNSIAILMSDHGARFSKMRATLQGKIISVRLKFRREKIKSNQSKFLQVNTRNVCHSFHSYFLNGSQLDFQMLIII